MRNLLRKENLLIILFLFIAVIFLEGLVFSNQLNYGFRDVDWQVLYIFKLYNKLSLNNLIDQFKVLGVYIPEAYYVGLLEKFIGLHPPQLHLVTHIFKVVTGIGVYILVLKIFKRKLLAFVTTVFYTISYTHAGVFFQLASGGYFLAISFMIAFLISYYHSLFNKNTLKWSIISGILLIITLLLKPERMYPLVFLVILIEVVIILVLKRFRKDSLFILSERAFLVFLPSFAIYLFYFTFFKHVFTGFSPDAFSISTNLRIDSIMKGNLQQLIYPFSSLGSMFLYGDHWKILGQLNFRDFGSYIISLILGPIIRISLITFVFLLPVYKRPFKLVATIGISVLIFGLVVYLLNINWYHINPSTRIHFDPNLLAIPAIFGFYIFLLACLFITKWINDRDSRLLPPIIGFSFAFINILLTWLPSDLQLIFMGPQRYLSIPSIGTSLLLAGLLVVIFDQLRQIKFWRGFAWMVFLILIPALYISYQVTTKFFDDELSFAGVRGTDQIRMKNKLRSILGEINTQDKSLFYFDESRDRDNAYSNEGTVLAGFEYWMKFNTDGTLNYFPDPGMIRTNVQCPEHTHQNCINILKQGLSVENNQKGIWYKDPIRGNTPNFYKLNNFYAFRFINKDIIDIRKEVLEELTK